MSDRSLVWNSDLVETLELDNLIRQGGGDDAFGEPPHREPGRARARGLSRARRTRNWLKHTLCWLRNGTAPEFGYRPVHLETLTNDVQSFPPRNSGPY